ncbi:MAG TPA: F0F1 ATP synthase subunit B [Candidatus Ozemobacteraceae bacterium]|nr:F0F1 ATP synthase subunit B [Candidatus Ozemobacteraceae bacterium]
MIRRFQWMICLLFFAISLAGPFLPALPAAEAAPAPRLTAEASAAGAHAGGHEEAGMFDFDPAILVSQVVNFFILLFVLRRFLFVPVQGILEERRKRILESMDAAEGKNREAAEIKGRYEKKLADVDQEAYQIRQKAISEAQAARDEILVEAKRKADELFAKAQKDISIERQKSWIQLREDVVRLTMTAAERVVEASLDDEKHHALIQRTIEQLEKEAGTTDGGTA